jgi:hypothetical protein
MYKFAFLISTLGIASVARGITGHERRRQFAQQAIERIQKE